MSKNNRRNTTYKQHNIEDVRIKKTKKSQQPAENNKVTPAKVKKYFFRLVLLKFLSWSWDQAFVFWEWICLKTEKLFEYIS